MTRFFSPPNNVVNADDVMAFNIFVRTPIDPQRPSLATVDLHPERAQWIANATDQLLVIRSFSILEAYPPAAFVGGVQHPRDCPADTVNAMHEKCLP